MEQIKKKRGNVLDVFLILLILLSLAGIILRWYSLRPREVGESRVSVTLTAAELHAQSADCLTVGERLYESDGSEWGRITEIQKTPTPIVTESEEGLLYGVYGEDERCDLTVTVEVLGEWHGESFLKGGRDAVLAGQMRELYSLRMRLEARVVKVAEADPEN